MSIFNVRTTEIRNRSEADIKAALINHLKLKGLVNSGTPILNEFSVFDGSRRVDLCIISNNRIIAFEIKSEADSLARLPGQVEDYLNYFDKVIVVTAPKFTAQIAKSVAKNVGVWEITDSSIIQKQKGSLSIIHDKERLTSMLRKKDLEALKKKEKKTSVEYIKESQVRTFVLKNISDRYQPYYKNFWDVVQNRDITIDDLKYLSPYIEDRKALLKRRQDLAKSWHKIQSPDFFDRVKTMVAQLKEGSKP